MAASIKVGVRLGIPLLVIAAILILSDDLKVGLAVMAVSAVVAGPVLGWSSRRLFAQIMRNEAPAAMTISIHGIGLAIPALGLCLGYMLGAALGHGRPPAGVIPMQCLLTFLLVVIFPVADLVLLRWIRRAGPARERLVRPKAAWTRVVLILLMAGMLMWIIGPPLNAALRLEWRGIARVLVACGADVNGRDRHGATPLWLALLRADTEMAVLLLNRDAVMGREMAGLGLQRAVETGNMPLLRLLLAKGAGPDTEYMGATPLLQACFTKNIEMITVLLERGADARHVCRYNGMPYDGKTPLDIATEGGDTRVIELLLFQGGPPRP